MWRGAERRVASEEDRGRRSFFSCLLSLSLPLFLSSFFPISRTHLTAHPVTTCSKFSKIPPWFFDFSSKCALCELVATADGTPDFFKCSTSLAAPGIALVCGKSVDSTSSRRRINSAASILCLFCKSKASTNTCPAASDVLPII